MIKQITRLMLRTRRCYHRFGERKDNKQNRQKYEMGIINAVKAKEVSIQDWEKLVES